MELEEENIEDQKPRAPCSGLRKELKECILESDCVKKVTFRWIRVEGQMYTVRQVINVQISVRPCRDLNRSYQI